MDAIVELFIRWIHLIAGILWFGGLFFSAIIATPILRRNIPFVENLQHSSAIRDRLRPIIRVAIHVLLITGAMNFYIVGLNTKMAFSRNYIVIFVVKMSCVALMVVFHSLHTSVFGRKLEAAVANLRFDDASIPLSIDRLQRQTQLFAILTILSGLAVFTCALSLKSA